MKKIVILTQPLGKNYGGIIQNYALQLILSSKGFQVVTAAREKRFNYFYRLLSGVKNKTYNRAIGKHRRVFTTEEYQEITAETQRFLDTKMNISEKLYSTKALKAYFAKESFDVVIVGSDQTWRPKYSPDIYNYYLDFLKSNKIIKKIAYASSFGTDEWEYNEKETKKCKNLVKQFDAVSVRESSGISLCEKYLSIKAEIVIDPTLLLDKEDYINLLSEKKAEQRGVFYYLFDRDKEKLKLVEEVAKRLGLTTFSTQPKKNMGILNDYDEAENYKYPSLESWLKSFYDAAFIVTDSFHGTVFSIIFNKPFISIVNHERGASRFYSLLEMFNLQNRIVADFENIDEKLFSEPIDYAKVNSLLKLVREKSFAFIEANV